MITKTFKTAELFDMGMPDEPPEGGRIIIDEVIGKRRWSVDHRLVVHFPDQPENEAWAFQYSVGATESQDETPWRYKDRVTATLVREQEVTVKKWLVVKDEKDKT